MIPSLGCCCPWRKTALYGPSVVARQKLCCCDHDRCRDRAAMPKGLGEFGLVNGNCWLVVWNIVIFHILGRNNNSNWLIFFERGWNHQPDWIGFYATCCFSNWGCWAIEWWDLGRILVQVWHGFKQQSESGILVQTTFGILQHGDFKQAKDLNQPKWVFYALFFFVGTVKRPHTVGNSYSKPHNSWGSI